MKHTSEAAFETAIEWVLLGDGVVRVQAQLYDHERAISCDEPLAFTHATQVNGWEKLEAMRP